MAGNVGKRTRKSVSAILDDVERNVALAREIAANRDVPVQAALRELHEQVKACRLKLVEAGEQ